MDAMLLDREPVAEQAAKPEGIEVSVLMPCLNEAQTVAICISKVQRCLKAQGVAFEVLVADNGSTDGSQAIALAAGARVIPIAAHGYGNALIGGIGAARGKYVIMGDADDSYDFSDLQPFIDALRNGQELVMGNRFRGTFQPGAMPALHRYIGNPVLSGIGRLLFGNPCGDFHCGLRGFDRAAILRLGLRASGMEFASEMVVKAALGRLRISEVPATLWPDGRIGKPHLRPWRDGWRHLRLLLALRFGRGDSVKSAAGRGRILPLVPVHRLPARPAAFTLPELVVVVGMIAALLGILLPAIGQARRSARSIQCLANLRQLATAYQLYVTDNDGGGLGYTHDLHLHDGRGYWVKQLRPLYVQYDSVRFCPEAVDTGGGWGGANLAWGPMDWTDNLAGSYGFNGWNHRPRGSQGGDLVFSGGPPDAYVRFARAESSRVPLFGDAAWPDAWPRDRDPAPPNLSDGDQQHQGKPPNENMMARFCIARHGKSVNLVYLDGHAANVQLADLWHQHWSNRFVPEDVALPRQ
jgi:prepilin-type processing-associated H-X9-DG protein